jgi:hypothetical protein
MLCPGSRWSERISAVRQLPAGLLTRDQLVSTDFLLASEGRLTVYWIPFERLNPTASVVIAGLTPGYGQMLAAFTAARDAVREGLDTEEILAQVARAASFAGAMRTNMVWMLDAIGLANALEINSTAELFGDHDDLVHATSALRYPVFVAGKNYGGSNPPVHRSPLLTSYVRDLLGPELMAVPQALIVSLGKAVGRCIGDLVTDGRMAEGRCLLGFPHPSGANGSRLAQFRANEPGLKRGVRRWASTR